MIIYYPQPAVLYSRQVSGSNLIETSVNIQPGNIFYFSGSGMASASWVTSSSYATTSSYALNGGSGGPSISASWASSSLSSSFVKALNGIQLFNVTTQTYYTLTVSGTVGHETLIIQ